jgi:hypothetical protein
VVVAIKEIFISRDLEKPRRISLDKVVNEFMKATISWSKGTKSIMDTMIRMLLHVMIFQSIVVIEDHIVCISFIEYSIHFL